jgi:protein gp37
LNKSKIEWCDSTWNPVTGCLHGCKYCYAEKIAKRFSKKDYRCKNCCQCPDCSGDKECPEGRWYIKRETTHILDTPSYIFYPQKRQENYPYGFEPTFHRYRLQEPSKKKKPKNIFVVSMGDLFGSWVPESWIDEVFQSCFNADHHRYMFLTKNPKRYNSIIDYTAGEERGTEEIEIWNNMWFGTTITCQADMERIKNLEIFSEGHKFLSIEPLQEKIELDLSGIHCPVCGSINVYQDNPATTPAGIPPYYCDDCGEWEGQEPARLIEWVIVGAETGRGAKPPEPEWVQSIIDQCRDAGIPIFLKNNLNWPMRIQEFPWNMERMV